VNVIYTAQQGDYYTYMPIGSASAARTALLVMLLKAQKYLSQKCLLER
jgi:hypothetical protein